MNYLFLSNNQQKALLPLTPLLQLTNKILEIEIMTVLFRNLFGVRWTEDPLVCDVMNEKRSALFTITMKV